VAKFLLVCVTIHIKEVILRAVEMHHYSTLKENSDPTMNRQSLTRYAWISISAAIATIGLKSLAYWLTGSVCLLSDAIESVVNLVGAIVALSMLTIAARPPDDEHLFGHSKAEYFSSGVEGSLILIAAITIGITAVKRLIAPKPLDHAAIGLAVSGIASLINFAVARFLLSAGKKHNSMLNVLKKYQETGVQFHAIRTSQAAALRFTSIRMLVHGNWTVKRGHQLVEQIKNDIQTHWK
jgi:divalent metal cation (Fe/Co/Zn/Cd) transporter